MRSALVLVQQTFQIALLEIVSKNLRIHHIFRISQALVSHCTIPVRHDRLIWTIGCRWNRSWRKNHLWNIFGIIIKSDNWMTNFITFLLFVLYVQFDILINLVQSLARSWNIFSSLIYKCTSARIPNTFSTIDIKRPTNISFASETVKGFV